MLKIENFRKTLNDVFDDNLYTKAWHNILDWLIICLILVSSLVVFLSTFSSISHRIAVLLHIIDVITTIFFTIEVSLRIWCADLLNTKYKGWKGRVRYCLSFYGIVDILSTYPSLLSVFTPLPITALKIFRVMRILRLFRYVKSFGILKRAVSSKKEELVISLSFLSVVTVILSFLLYYAEHEAQPKLCENAWLTMVWAFAKYLGDPGKIADFQMVTVCGNVIAIFVGVLGIAIFAVPAGLISSGFLEAIEEDKHQQEIKKNQDKLHRAFERKLDPGTRLQMVPQFLSLIEIQARMRMTENEILEAVDASRDFRIINIACTIPIDKRPADRLAVEHFVVNTSYGCKIDRGSRVTIVSPSNIVDPAIGYFAYYLAKMGGFNFVSRELGETRPYRSFYLWDTDKLSPEQKEYMRDIEQLSGGSNSSWIITMLAASGQNECEYAEQIHFGYGLNRGLADLDAPNVLIRDKATGERLMAAISQSLEKNFGIMSERQQYHTTANPKLFFRHIANKNRTNGLVIRAAWSQTLHNHKRMAIARNMAKAIREIIEPNHDIPHSEEMETKDIGYNGYTN